MRCSSPALTMRRDSRGGSVSPGHSSTRCGRSSRPTARGSETFSCRCARRFLHAQPTKTPHTESNKEHTTHKSALDHLKRGLFSTAKEAYSLLQKKPILYCKRSLFSTAKEAYPLLPSTITRKETYSRSTAFDCHPKGNLLSLYCLRLSPERKPKDRTLVRPGRELYHLNPKP